MGKADPSWKGFVTEWDLLLNLLVQCIYNPISLIHLLIVLILRVAL